MASEKSVDSPGCGTMLLGNPLIRWIGLGILSMVLLIARENSWGETSGASLRARLARARAKQAAQAATLSPLERDLLFFTNFEQDGVALLDNSEAVRYELEKDHYRPGKFGRGYYFEKARHNLLPGEMADVETGMQGFK